MTTNLEDIYFPVKHGKPAFAPKKEHIIQHHFTSQPTFLQGFISQDINDTGGKQFITVSNFSAWLENDVIASQCDRHLYEIVPTGRPVHPYFDIEYDDAQHDTLETIDAIFSVLVHCFSLLGVTFTPADVSIFSASGNSSSMPSGVKASYHFIFGGNAVFRNTKEHKVFIDSIVLPYINELEQKDKFFWTDTHGVTKCILDNVPYGSDQSFRLPYQSKLGSLRPFVPIKPPTTYCIGIYADNDDIQFIELPTPTYSAPLTYHNHYAIPSQSPEFERARALCELLTPEFLYNYTNALELIFCLAGLENSARMHDLIHSTCARASNYEWKWVNTSIKSLKYKGFTTSTLRKWAEQCTDKERVSKVVQRHPVNYAHELFAEHMQPSKYTCIEERYLSNSAALQRPFADDVDTLVIKSLLGTGKTQFIKNNIIATRNYNRMLIISPRKSYTHSQKGALPEFTSYLDVYGDLVGVDHLIIQVESLHRIGNLFQKYDLVLLDEVESILNQLHSVKTNAGNLITNHEALAMAVSTAHHVIMADAFISDRTFNFCKELRSYHRTHYIENVCNPYARQAIFLRPQEDKKCVANLGGFCERICDALRAGKRIVIVWTSKRKGEWFVQNFLESWVGDNKPSWLFYHSSTSKEDQELLKDVHAGWRSVQCLMMTTSITVGISYDPKIAEAEFDEAFLYGSAASAMPRDIAQALFRVRSLKANRLTYVIDSRGSFVSGACGFSNIWNEVAAKESKLVREHPLVKWSTCPTWARYNFVYCENEERSSRAEYKSVLEEYLVRSGYELVEEVHIPTQTVNAISLDTDNMDALFWENIQNIDSDAVCEIQKAMKRGEASTEEILQYKKANFRTQFVVSCTEEELECWWNRFYTTDSEGRFWNIVKEKRWTVDDVARAEAGKRYAVMAGDSVKERETMERFLAIMGMRHSQEEVVISTEQLEKIGEELSKIDKELRKGLGLRTSERKGEWKTKNTIDLVTVILEGWGRSSVESIEHRYKKNAKIIRDYSLQINKNNKIWENIYVSNINISDFIIKTSK